MNILQTTDLKKYYGTEPNITKALDGVTLSIEEGVTEIIRAIEQNYLGWHEIIFLETLKALSLLLRPYF